MYITEHLRYKRIKHSLLASFKFKAKDIIEIINKIEHQYILITNLIGGFLLKKDVSELKKYDDRQLRIVTDHI